LDVFYSPESYDWILYIWGFPKIVGKPPKWMVKIKENPIKMDDLGENHLFSETPTLVITSTA